MDTTKARSWRCVKIYCGVTVAIITIFIVVSIILYFTVFKPKDPRIIAHPTNLENVQFQLYPNVSINATLVLTMTIDNRNYGGFEFKDSVAYVYYRGMLIGEVPIEHSKVPARGSFTMTTYANITGGKMATDPDFYNDIASGTLNFTSTTSMHGKVSVLKIVKVGAKVDSFCDICVHILTQEVDPVCHSKVEF
ncbi:late embryogenesis abundant protein At1g64065-like [Cynara cardunculus var. scolymus]|uniref:late embryogenesis abundant protein At1g64065-like n=1 Tax=Cynara cardunculus var. scolymus TaxID=59895 RepID=UPI000D631387|nr:late embryogenesis abundant protein At1g64065-like [Cynara cardunculus var. scolymus]